MICDFCSLKLPTILHCHLNKHSTTHGSDYDYHRDEDDDDKQEIPTEKDEIDDEKEEKMETFSSLL